MKLLENELIQKYFGCNECRDHIRISESADRHTSQRILQAMAEPVKVDELYLAISDQGIPSGPHTFTSSDVWKFHCQWLRLPDQFQKPKPEHQHTWGCACGVTFQNVFTKPDPVEAKIKRINERIANFAGIKKSEYSRYLEDELRELVALARKQ